jgi:retron-type reverse transcriptase
MENLFETLEEVWRKEWLDALAEEHREKTLEPGAVRRKLILKENGKPRLLEIPKYKDMVAREPDILLQSGVFDREPSDETRASREGRSAKEAAGKVQRLLNGDRCLNVVDTDLLGYFKTIPIRARNREV